jgi:hypothetical protein
LAAAPPPEAAPAAASVYSQPVTSVAAEPALASAEPVLPPPTSHYFYSTLAPYGSWLYIEPYGWCWQPTCAVTVVDWRPYGHSGRWLYTTSGWYWQSYSWGWAPFHYGNWYASPACGCVGAWERLGAAWVTWRYTPAYCGWAPASGLRLVHRWASPTMAMWEVRRLCFGLSSSCCALRRLGPLLATIRPPCVPLLRWSTYNHSTVINNLRKQLLKP